MNGQNGMSATTRLHRIGAVLVALALALMQVPLAAIANDTQHDTFRSILGSAVNYGIVAETFTLENGDAQTNVAAKTGTSKTQTGNDLTNPVEQPFILTRVGDVFRIKGNDAYVMTTPTETDKVIGTGGATVTFDTSQTSEELDALVDNMLNRGHTQSQLLATREPNAWVIYDHPSQKYVLDLRDQDAGTYHATINETVYGELSREASKLRIFKNDDQTVVLTVAGDAKTLHKFDLNGRGADSYLNQDAGVAPETIVWNFPEATNLDIIGSVTGVILAPQATVTVSATSSGWLLAKDVVIGSGEWHNVFQGVVPRPDAPTPPVTPENPETPEDPENPETPEDPDTPEDPEDDPVTPDDPNETPDSTPDATPRLAVRATKTSLEYPNQRLSGATYGLWQVHENDQDEYLYSATSDENGLLTFVLPTADAATYYLLEEDAPHGHLVDPFPTDEFTMGSDEDGYYLRHAGEDELVRAAAETSDGTLLFDYTPDNNPVADHAAQVMVSKLDRTTNEYLDGARLRITDKETGNVVAEWTSGEDARDFVSVLDTERVYILSERTAPDGYLLATNVEFMIHAEGIRTTGELLSGASTSAGARNATLSTDTDGVLHLRLYNAGIPVTLDSTPLPSTGTTTNTDDSQLMGTTSSKPLPVTADAHTIMPIILLATLGALSLLVAHAMKQHA